MASTKAVPVRFRAELLAALDARAEAEGVSRSAVIVRLVSEGLGKAPVLSVSAPRASPPDKVERAKAALQQAEAGAAHLGRAKPPEAGGYAVQVGPTRRAPGSMLKARR